MDNRCIGRNTFSFRTLFGAFVCYSVLIIGDHTGHACADEHRLTLHSVRHVNKGVSLKMDVPLKSRQV